MKVRIIDLMDHYYGDHARPDPVPLPGETGADRPRQTGAVKKDHWQRPLLVAAALLLVLTGGVALGLGLGRGQEETWTMGEGSSVPESAIETLPPELPAVDTGSDLEETTGTVTEPSNLVAPTALSGTFDDVWCEGNIFCIDDSYYTMTDQGPEPLETRNLRTTVEFHGTWDVDIDYAVVDGELLFHNNTDRNQYTVVDGEKMNWIEYQEWKWEQMGVPADTPDEEKPNVDLREVEWITPQVATAQPLAGSADTVMLSVRRDDISYMDNSTYPFFYNIFTGEITDPLANVPQLFEHGQLSLVMFNSSLTRALVEIWGEPVYSDGSSGSRTYVCDFTTGEMTWVVDLLKPSLPAEDLYEQYDPEVGLEGSLWNEGSCMAWADDDTLLFSMTECIPLEVEGSVEDYGPDEVIPEEVMDPWERHSWLFAYNMAEQALTYRLKDVGPITITCFNQPYLHDFDYDDETGAFTVVDTAAGRTYSLPGVDTPDGRFWDETETRTVTYSETGALYLIDDTQLGWADLRESIQLPEAEVTNVRLITDDWLCLSAGDQLYFYRIPADLALSPLNET